MARRKGNKTKKRHHASAKKTRRTKHKKHSRTGKGSREPISDATLINNRAMESFKCLMKAKGASKYKQYNDNMKSAYKLFRKPIRGKNVSPMDIVLHCDNSHLSNSNAMDANSPGVNEMRKALKMLFSAHNENDYTAASCNMFGWCSSNDVNKMKNTIIKSPFSKLYNDEISQVISPKKKFALIEEILDDLSKNHSRNKGGSSHNIMIQQFKQILKNHQRIAGGQSGGSDDSFNRVDREINQHEEFLYDLDSENNESLLFDKALFIVLLVTLGYYTLPAVGAAAAATAPDITAEQQDHLSNIVSEVPEVSADADNGGWWWAGAEESKEAEESPGAICMRIANGGEGSVVHACWGGVLNSGLNMFGRIGAIGGIVAWKFIERLESYFRGAVAILLTGGNIQGDLYTMFQRDVMVMSMVWCGQHFTGLGSRVQGIFKSIWDTLTFIANNTLLLGNDFITWGAINIVRGNRQRIWQIIINANEPRNRQSNSSRGIREPWAAEEYDEEPWTGGGGGLTLANEVSKYLN